ncbi:UPF0246 protein [Pilimelia terevasa]|uniref:UPF0246 protein GCM10010124_32270 n=2 Tax=Pilimelia terevasa TaxID=53372 RepID=A0A8J3FLR4_9ACTN|nr:UPF0246 protein [Pilimelia terevasa]
MILLHSSKAMRVPAPAGGPARATGTPALVADAVTLMRELRALTPAGTARVMAVSADLAARTRALHDAWDPAGVSAAADTFVGDIYSGLRARDLSPADRDRAQDRLRILSGLYGILRPDDLICPYRLEMGYRLPSGTLYAYWGDRIAAQLPAEGGIVDLTAAEYGRTVTRHVAADRLVTPKFLTVDARTGEPGFVTVHAKIARGVYARWLVTARVESAARLPEFAEIGYRYDGARSRPAAPVYVCREFGGKGLSVRLT